MNRTDERNDVFSQEDHQVAYIFDGEDSRPGRPSKRRRVSKTAFSKEKASDATSLFVPLFNGAERPECVRLRQTLFEDSWAKMDKRIKGVLRDSNSAILDQVSAFVDDAKLQSIEQIPAAFIITGPNIASQGLLFDQLAETLRQSSSSKFVTLKSSEVATLKAVLKKVIRDATATAADDQDDVQVGSEQDGRRYLDYDLEALQASIMPENCEHVFLAFQDSEGFDSSLLSDLITLFNSWRPRIPFTLLFGIATSVELLQGRLLKSACRLIYGAQFDCVQTGAILETVFKSAVAASDVPLRLGGNLLQGMLDRQHDQIAGIQAFISSLKYAYMCHFYANPLSILASREAEQGNILQPEHFEAIRNLASFRSHIEVSVNTDASTATLEIAKSMIENDQALLVRVEASARLHQKWISDCLRCLLVMEAAGAQKGSFSRAYVDAMTEGAGESDSARLVDSVRRLSVQELLAMLRRILAIFSDGDSSLNLGPATEKKSKELQASLEIQRAELEALAAQAESEGITLRSKYSGQSKVIRTTVIAQKVQLSRDSAALRDEDKQLTDIVDEVTKTLGGLFDECRPEAVVLWECWVYDSRWPSRDVFVPRPRAVFERSLSRPHDYLACSCCRPGEGGVQATLPATSILHHLYQDTGSLINAADLWQAFYALVTQGGAKAEGEEEVKAEEDDERRALVMFYQGLAEMSALGFVKASKKKADHIAKVKWL